MIGVVDGVGFGVLVFVGVAVNVEVCVGVAVNVVVVVGVGVVVNVVVGFGVGSGVGSGIEPQPILFKHSSPVLVTVIPSISILSPLNPYLKLIELNICVQI
jgi:hypothetical protein